MATEGKVPPSGDGDPVARRIADLSKKLDEVKSATASAKAAGHVMTLLLVVAAIFGVVSLASPFWALKERPEDVKRAMIAEFDKAIKPELMRELEESQSKTGPVVREMIYTKVRERGPEFVDAFDAETKTFMENVKKMGETMWKDHIQNLDAQIYKRIEERVPELADHEKAEVAITNAHQAVNAAIERLISEYLEEHVNSISSIQEQITNFPIPTHVKDKSDDELRDAFMDLLATYSTNTLKAGLSPQTREFLADLGSDNSKTEKESAPAAVGAEDAGKGN